MNKYEVVEAVANITGGVLELEEGQSNPRSHKLRHIGGKKFEVLLPVQFKLGELVSYEGELPRVLQGSLKIVEKKQAKSKESSPD